MGFLWNFRLQSFGLFFITLAANEFKRQNRSYQLWNNPQFYRVVVIAGLVFNFQSKLMWFGGFFGVISGTLRDNLLTLENESFKRFQYILWVKRWGDDLKKSVENERARFLNVCSMGFVGMGKVITISMWAIAIADCVQSVVVAIIDAPLTTFSTAMAFFIIYLSLYTNVWDFHK
eukprot:UN25549